MSTTFQKYVGRIGGIVAGGAGLVTAATSAVRYHNNMNISKAAITGIVFNFICSIILLYVSICHNSLQLTFPTTWRPNLRLIQLLTLIQIIAGILVLGSSPKWQTEEQQQAVETARRNLQQKEKAFYPAFTAWENAKKSKAPADKINQLQATADNAKKAMKTAQDAYDKIAPVVPSSDIMIYVSLGINLTVFLAIVYTFNHESAASIRSVAAMQKRSV